MTLPPILTLPYWFMPSPPPFMPLMEKVIPGVFIALVVLGVAAQMARTRRHAGKAVKRLLGRAATTTIVAGLIGLVLYAFYIEQIPYLMMRVWYLVLFLWFVWMAWRIYRYATVDLPEITEREKEYHAFTKWLPKGKR